MFKFGKMVFVIFIDGLNVVEVVIEVFVNGVFVLGYFCV